MKYKLIAFDLDGTLVEGLEFSWQHIHDYFNTDVEKRKIMKEKFFRDEITYQQWAMHDILMWKEKNVTKYELIKAIGSLSVMKGGLETISELKKRGFVVGVISGSLSFILDYLFPNHPFDFVYLTKVIFSKDGTIKSIIPTEFDFIHKASALKKEAERYGFRLEECVFVGDNVNDVEIAKTAGLSFAFNCNKKELLDVVNHVIHKKDMREILKLI